VKRWSLVFAALLSVLVLRNAFLFTTLIHETGDTGANSIIVSQAKHFELLVGNYSRQGFNHPGPGYFYVQAAGEWFFHDLLGLVPAPWNGQLLALYVLNAAFLATVVLIVAKQSGSWTVATASLFALIALIALQPQIVNNPWMPFLYVPSFLLLLVASASVAAGRGEFLWAAVLSGGLLAHGHAVFLLFAPAVIGLALILGFRRYRPLASRDLAISSAVLALLLLPVVVNTVVNWPGEFAKYIGYGSDSPTDDGRSILDAAGYAYWYLWPFRFAWLGALIIGAAVWFLARRKDKFTRAGMILGGLVIGLLIFYAYVAIDHLDDPYMGFFAWAVPLFLVIGLVMWAGEKLPQRYYAVPLVATVAVMLVVPGFRTITNDDQPAIPGVVSAFAAAGQGRAIVIETGDDLGPEVPGLILWSRRSSVEACVRDPRWSFITTEDFICTPEQIRTGFVVRRVRIYPETPAQPGEIARAGASAFVAATPLSATLAAESTATPPAALG
jgi:hypothetical protein